MSSSEDAPSRDFLRARIRRSGRRAHRLLLFAEHRAHRESPVRQRGANLDVAARRRLDADARRRRAGTMAARCACFRNSPSRNTTIGCAWSRVEASQGSATRISSGTSTNCWRRRTTRAPRRSIAASTGATGYLFTPETLTRAVVARFAAMPALTIRRLCTFSLLALCAAGAGSASHSALGKRRARLRSAARRTRAAPGLVVQEHPQSFAHGVPAARGQGQWHRGHRRGGRRPSRAGVQSRRRRTRAVSREPRSHGVRAEIPAVPRTRLEVHLRQHRRRTSAAPCARCGRAPRNGTWIPSRIGVMGWSAGGEVAALVAYPPAAGDAQSA